VKKIILSLDNIPFAESIKIMKQTTGRVWGYKLRRQVIEYDIRMVVALTKQYGNVMVDFKLFDIPSAMNESLKLHFGCGVDISTIHCSSCYVPSLDIDSSKIAGVTILTSMNKYDFSKTYNTHHSDMQNKIKSFIKDAIHNKYGYIVCSSMDLLDGDISSMNIKKICPGIRPSWYKAKDDQDRTMTPKQAIDAGADLLVIGRPIIESEGILKTIDMINNEIE